MQPLSTDLIKSFTSEIFISKYLKLVTETESLSSPCPSLLLHIGVTHSMQGYEGLLDSLGAGPLQHIMGTSCLIISARKPRTTKRLLSHHGPSGLVIHIKVSCSSSQNLGSLVSKISERRCLLISSSLQQSYWSLQYRAPVRE